MYKRKNAHKAVVALMALTLAAAACGSADGEPGAGGPVDTSVTTDSTIDSTTGSTTDSAATTTTNPPVTGGWIDGEPDWLGAGGEEITLAGAPTADAPTADTEASFDAAVDEVRIEAPLPEPPPANPVDGAEPVPIEEPFPEPGPVNGTPLRAGSVDDNADYQGFLEYVERIQQFGIALRDFDSSGRIVVTVKGSDGRPVSGVDVSVRTGDDAISLRTTADGTIRFLPSYLGLTGDADLVFDFSVGDTTVSAAAGTDTELTLDREGRVDVPVALDVLFLLDATGSMGDEIDRLKATIDIVAERVALLDPAPDVHFAMTLYRDQGDTFVTANYDFTSDVAVFQAALADVVADGGGDYPEALDEGLADALAKPSWRDPASAVQLIFVVADAPPQVNREVAVPYTDSIRDAAERGIKIFPVASSESDDQAEAVFRQMAQATGAPFVFLSNGADGASIGESSDIQSTDYEELALDELVVRLIAEELNDLNGEEQVTVPSTVAPGTTNPEGQ